jgi:hypothetical protein
VLMVFKRDASDMRFLELMHGKTEHGLQFLDPVRAAWPTAYYNEGSGVGRAMGALPTGSRRRSAWSAWAPARWPPMARREITCAFMKSTRTCCGWPATKAEPVSTQRRRETRRSAEKSNSLRVSAFLCASALILCSPRASWGMAVPTEPEHALAPEPRPDKAR